MSPSDSDRALLELLLEPRQDYASVAALLGVGEPEVRQRAAEALGDLVGSGSAASPETAAWALGLARGHEAARLFADPAAAAQAGALAGALKANFPDAALPELPALGAPPTSTQPKPPGAAPSPSEAPVTGASVGEAPLPERVAGALRATASKARARPRLYGAIGIGIVFLVLVALVAVLVSGGGGSDDRGGRSGTSLIALRPLTEGSESTGEALLVRAGKEALVQVELRGLAASAPGESYVVWLYSSQASAYPLARDVVKDNGRLGGPAPVPPGLRPPLASFGCVDVSLASNRELARVLTGRSAAVRHVGRSVLRGEIPREGETAGSGAGSRCVRKAP